MENLQITWKTLLAVLGGVSVLLGGIRAIVGLFSPYKTLKEEVSRHGQLLDKDKKKIDDLLESDKMQMRALLSLMDHAITGSSIDRLKSEREAMQHYLAWK